MSWFSALAKRVIALAPYRIVRAKPGRKVVHADAYDHNSVEASDARFTDDQALERYLTPARVALYEATLALIAEFRAPGPGESLGDFGCGPAFFLDLVVERFPGLALYGYDQAPLTLRKAGQRLPGVVFEVRDIYAAPTRQHEIVVCSQTLEHLPKPAIALQRLVEATKAGGMCVLTVPDGRKDTYSGHINFWSPESWSEWLSEHLVQHKVTTKYLPVGEAGGSSLAAVIQL